MPGAEGTLSRVVGLGRDGAREGTRNVRRLSVLVLVDVVLDCDCLEVRGDAILIAKCEAILNCWQPATRWT